MSELVYKMHKWSDYLYDEINENSNYFIESAHAGSNKLNNNFPDFMRELFGRFYSELTKLDEIDPVNHWAERLHKETDKVEEFKQLQEHTRGDTNSSASATIRIADELINKMALPIDTFNEFTKIDQVIKGLESINRDEDSDYLRGKISRLKERKEQIEQRINGYVDKIDGTVIRRIIQTAAKSAIGDLENSKQLIEGFGIGLTGSSYEKLTFEENIKLLQTIKRNPEIQKIILMAGRIREYARFKQQTKANKAQNEISSIHQSNNLGRMLPVELIQLGGEEEVVFFKKYLERQLLCYELKGKEPKEQGPVIFMIDKSMSMQGSRMDWAKCIALAMLDIAISQNREGIIIYFDTNCSTKHIHKFDKTTSRMKLIDMLSVQASGGTVIDPALRTAMKFIKESQYEDADLVILTDGAINKVDQQLLREYNRLKESNGFDSFGILLDDFYCAHVMKDLCETFWNKKSTNLDDTHLEIERIFEI